MTSEAIRSRIVKRERMARELLPYRTPNDKVTFRKLSREIFQLEREYHAAKRKEPIIIYF